MKKTIKISILMLFFALYSITVFAQCSNGYVTLKIKTVIHEKGSIIHWVIRDNKTRQLIKSSPSFPDNQNLSIYYDSVCVDQNATLVLAVNNDEIPPSSSNNPPYPIVNLSVNNISIAQIDLNYNVFKSKTFNVSPQIYDAALRRISVPDFLSSSDILVGRAIVYNVSNPSGNMNLLRLDTLTLSYSIDNGPVYTKKSHSAGVPIDTDFEFVGKQNPLTNYALGKHELKVWISDIKSNSNSSLVDSNKLNDTLSKNIYIVPNDISSKILVIHRTGEWCGYCGPGQTSFINLLGNYPDRLIGLSIHNKNDPNYPDQFSISSSESFIRAFAFSDFPVNNPNWRFTADGSTWFANYEDESVYSALGKFRSPFNFNSFGNYQINSSNDTFLLNFSSSLISNTNIILQDNEQYTINYWIVIDSLVGVQYDYGCSCWLNNYTHRHVLRQTINNLWGDSIIAGNLNINQLYNYNSVNKTLDFGLLYPPNQSNFKIVATIQKYNDIDVYDREILASDYVTLTPTGINKASIAPNLNVFPNPANESVTILSGSNSIGVITITDLLGKTVKEVKVNTKKTVVNTADLQTGLYFIKLTQNNVSTTKKIMIAK